MYPQMTNVIMRIGLPCWIFMVTFVLYALAMYTWVKCDK